MEQQEVNTGAPGQSEEKEGPCWTLGPSGLLWFYKSYVPEVKYTTKKYTHKNSNSTYSDIYYELSTSSTFTPLNLLEYPGLLFGCSHIYTLPSLPHLVKWLFVCLFVLVSEIEITKAGAYSTEQNPRLSPML